MSENDEQNRDASQSVEHQNSVGQRPTKCYLSIHLIGLLFHLLAIPQYCLQELGRNRMSRILLRGSIALEPRLRPKPRFQTNREDCRKNLLNSQSITQLCKCQ